MVSVRVMSLDCILDFGGEMQDKLRRRVGKTLKIFMRLLLV